MDSQDILFYKDLSKHSNIKRKVRIQQLYGHEKVKDYYELHLFDNGFSSVYNQKSKTYLKPYIVSKRSYYIAYKLRKIDDKNKTAYLHRVVALAFINGFSTGLEVNHIDFNQLNNHIDNLEWVTRGENARHAISHGASKTTTIGVDKYDKLSDLSRSLLYSGFKDGGGLSYSTS